MALRLHLGLVLVHHCLHQVRPLLLPLLRGHGARQRHGGLGGCLHVHRFDHDLSLSPAVRRLQSHLGRLPREEHDASKSRLLQKLVLDLIADVLLVAHSLLLLRLSLGEEYVRVVSG